MAFPRTLLGATKAQGSLSRAGGDRVTTSLLNLDKLHTKHVRRGRLLRINAACDTQKYKYNQLFQEITRAYT